MSGVEASLEALRTARRNIKSAEDAAGIATAAGDGLDVLDDRLIHAVVPQGRPVDARVAQSHAVYRGDPVRWCKEACASGEAIRFATEGVKVLAADRIAVDGAAGVATVFTQNGSTYLKTVFPGEAGPTLGPTVTLLSGLEARELVTGRSRDGTKLYLFFTWQYDYTSDDGAELTDQSNDFAVFDGATVRSDTLFGASGMVRSDLANYNVLYHNLMIASNDGVDVVTTDGDEAVVLGYTQGLYAYLTSVAVSGDGTAYYGAVVRAKYDNELNNEPVYDTDGYWRGWALAVGPEAAYMSCPVTTQRVMLFFRWAPAASAENGVLSFTQAGYAASPVYGCVPSVAMVRGTGRRHGAVAVHGVTRTITGEDGTTAIKSCLALESWYLDPAAEDAAGAYLLCYGEEDAAYAANVGLVCAGDLSDGATLCGYCHEGTFYSMVVDWSGPEPIGSAPAAMGAFEEFAAVCPVSGSQAFFVYQKGGSGYAEPLEIREAVVPYRVQGADGVAVRGGAPGELIPVRRFGEAEA